MGTRKNGLVFQNYLQMLFSKLLPHHQTLSGKGSGSKIMYDMVLLTISDKKLLKSYPQVMIKNALINSLNTPSKKKIQETFKKSKLKTKLRSEEHTSELQSRGQLVCRLLLEK